MQTKSGERSVILVLEPEILVRMTIAEYLRACGYRVIEGTVPEDVWTLVSVGHPLDIVFSEVRLRTDWDGFEIAKRLRKEQPEIEVILTSSLVDAAQKSEELCAEGPIKKPYTSEEVLARIKRLFVQRQSDPQAARATQ